MYYSRKKTAWAGLKVGVLITGALVIAVVATLFGDKIETLFIGDEPVVYAVFDHVKGLKIGAPIRFSGIEVGAVKAISIRSDGMVQVALPIARDTLKRMNRNAEADILTLGLLGDKYISIKPGAGSAEPLHPGDTIRGRIPVELRDIVETTQRSLQRVSQFIQKLDTALGPEKGTLGKLISEPDVYHRIHGIADGLARILADLNAGKGLLGKIMTEETLYDEVLSAARDVRRFAHKLNTAGGSLNRFIEDPALYEALAGASGGLEAAAEQMRSPEGTLGRLMTDGRLYDNFRRLAERLDTILGRIENGEGLLGQLSRDEHVVEDIRSALREFMLLIKDIRSNPDRYFSFELGG